MLEDETKGHQEADEHALRLEVALRRIVALYDDTSLMTNEQLLDRIEEAAHDALKGSSDA